MELKSLLKYSDKNKGYIYVIINNLNGMKYVGQTNDPYKRCHKHLSTARLNNYTYKSYLYPAINKYGEDNFSFKIVEICELDIVNEREIYWIQYLDTVVPNGYNITPGGNSLYGEDNPFYGRKHSDKTKEKISQKNSGRIISQEERDMRRVINSGERNPFYGKTHSSETIEKIIKSNRESGAYERFSKRMKENNPGKFRKYKKVAMVSVETGEILEIFENAMDAGKRMSELGLTKAKRPSNIITGVCNNHESSACGYFWRYID